MRSHWKIGPWFVGVLGVALLALSAGGALASAFIPTFAASLAREDEAGERSYLGEDEIMAARAKVEDKIEEYCGAK